MGFVLRVTKGLKAMFDLPAELHWRDCGILVDVVSVSHPVTSVDFRLELSVLTCAY